MNFSNTYYAATHETGLPSRANKLNEITTWSLISGVIFLIAAFGNGPLHWLPVSMPLVYLGLGLGLSPWGLNVLDVDLISNTKTLETLTEIAVLVSLLTAGLQLAPSWSHMWRAPIPLASLGMIVTVAGVAVVGHYGAGLSFGAAILLGAVLAPTDPVLANEVQVEHEEDTDKLRYALTGEAGLNDGAAFPFIMLGLGLVGVHEIGDWGWRWVAVDLVWATVAGLAVGWTTGYAISHLAVWAKRNSRQPAATEELLILGLIGLSYGGALAIKSYGFLAVFAAGIAMRHFTQHDKEQDTDNEADRLMRTVIGVNHRFGEILEVALVVLIGALLANHWTLAKDWPFAIALFFLVRPLGVLVSLWRSDVNRTQITLISFFGIRGIGSLYYLSYAIGHGLDDEVALRIGGIVLTTITLSLLIHSSSATWLLRHYKRKYG